MAITLEEMRARNRGKKRPVEEFEVEEGYTLTIGGVASFGAMRARAGERWELERALVALPLHDADGNAVPVDDEMLRIAVMVACSVREPQMTIRDVLELSVAYPLRFGELFERILELNTQAVEARVEEAEQRLAADPGAPPCSE